MSDIHVLLLLLLFFFFFFFFGIGRKTTEDLWSVVVVRTKAKPPRFTSSLYLVAQTMAV